MNGYIAFFKGKRLEIRAETIYAAQLEAARQFKTKKPGLVNIALAELHGEQYIHRAVD